MGTVNVNGVNATIYGTLTGAQQYLEFAIGSGADAWRALVDAGNDDQQGRLLVQAFRMLEAMTWAGAKTSDVQTEQWPRTGVEDIYGDEVDDATVPTNIVNGEYELAALLAATAALTSSALTGSNTKKLAAGPVSIEYFRPTDTLDTATVLPKQVMDLVGQYLASSTSTASGATAYGVDPCDEPAAESQFESCDDYERIIR